MGLIDGMLTAGFGFASGLLDREQQELQFQQTMDYNEEQAEKNREFQTSEREAAQQWNLEQWNRENEYNSPAEQMKRAMAAGINPNAVAAGIGGAGSQSGTVRTSGQSGDSASVSQPPLPASMSSSIANIAQSLNTIWQNDLVRAQTVGENIKNKFAEAREKAGLRKTEAETRRQIAAADLDGEQKNQVKELTNAIKQKTPIEVKQLQAAFELTEQEIKNAQATEKKIQAETSEIGSRDELNVAQKANVEEDTANKKKEGKILDEKVIYEKAIAEAAKAGAIIGMSELQTLHMMKSKGIDVKQYLENKLTLMSIDAGVEIDKEDVKYGNKLKKDLVYDLNSTKNIFELPDKISSLDAAYNALGEQSEKLKGVLDSFNTNNTDYFGNKVINIDGEYYTFKGGNLVPIAASQFSSKNKKSVLEKFWDYKKKNSGWRYWR